MNPQTRHPWRAALGSILSPKRDARAGFMSDPRFKILAVALVPLVMLGALLAWYGATSRIDDLRRSLSAQGAAITRQLAPTVELPLYAQDVATLQTLADSAASAQDVVSVAIFDRTGKPLVSSRSASRSAAKGANSWRPGPGSGDRTPEGLFIAEVFASGIPALDSATLDTAPGLGRGERLGWVALEMSDRPMIEGSRRVLRDTVLLTFAALIPTIILGVAVAFGVGRALGNHLEAARRANQAKSDFLARMSHEIRTPISAAIGFARLLGHERLSARGEEYARAIGHAGDQLLMIVDDLLDSARIESGTIRFEIAWHPVRALLNDAVTMFRPAAAAGGLDLELRIDGELPAEMECDGARLQQILTNLLANAVKFTPAGRIELHAWAQCEDRRPDPSQSHRSCALTVEVTDNGIGISLEDQARIFEPFEQVDGGVTRRHGGSGLGLSISRALAEGMGGWLHVRSAPGRGSTFVLVLPRLRCRERTEPARTDPVRTDPVNVLVVEDDELGREALVAMLQRIGCRVHAVGGLTGTLEAIAASTFDLIVMDLHLPGASGLEIAREIRANTRHARASILMQTADVQAEAAHVDSLDLVDDWTVKPVSEERLRSAVEATRQSSRQRHTEPSSSGMPDEFRERVALKLLEHSLFLRRAWSAGDQEGAVREAHQMAGISGYLDIPGLVEVMRRIEADLAQIPGGPAGVRQGVPRNT